MKQQKTKNKFRTHQKHRMKQQKKRHTFPRHQKAYMKQEKTTQKCQKYQTTSLLPPLPLPLPPAPAPTHSTKSNVCKICKWKCKDKSDLQHDHQPILQRPRLTQEIAPVVLTRSVTPATLLQLRHLIPKFSISHPQINVM